MWCKTDGEKENRGPDGDVGIQETLVQIAKANGVRWYGYGHVLRKALEFEVKGKRKRGRGRHKWRRRARVLVWRKRMP